ncbi:family 20 glycosylhydrolase [Terriglobus roseus]|uniref:beta-N-acetylhexosaminidase n=1 Tax=Terriglobus roseus TaxID=392734 RepID=A0A1H4M5D8_9BACT|nr:family 20 glycosylhydrolase [Terriglobus roseus]SEB77988.1 hexosaminidase [Terriglobus roseus]
MKTISRTKHALLPVAFCSLSLFATSQAQTANSVIPAPARVEASSGTLDLRRGLAVRATTSDVDASSVTRYLQGLLATTHTPALLTGEKTKAPQLTFVHREAHRPEKGGDDESYALDVTPAGVTITAGSRAGYLYGAISLWQMMAHAPGSISAVHIEDGPRFRWRGIMLDSARHMQSEQFILQLLDYMAEHKLNTFHWHLTEDQGWRIEIKRYPKLTSVGGFRPQTMPPWQAGSNAPTGPYGGFYTQDQIRHVVAYAKERNITVVPEIEMPGHATAALVAYPELGSAKGLPGMPVGWGIYPTLFNTDDATFEFLQNVLTEVMDLFPGEYIHVGGDEALKDQWKSNPTVQAKMKELGIHDEDAMQSWFMGRMEKFINAHGRRLVGWDEILQGGLSPNATVMSWRGIEGAVSAAKQGHDAILTPNRPLYFNYRQSDATDETAGRDPVNSLADVYNFKALPAVLTTAEQAHVLGVQGSIWSEYVLTEDRVQHMLFPRAAALAEMAWSPDGRRDYKDFLHRLPADLQRTEDAGVKPALSVFEVQAHATPTGAGDHASLQLATQGNLGEIHYTLDGSPVKKTSPVFNGDLQISLPSEVHALAFDGTTALGLPMTQKITLASTMRRDSRELDACTGSAGIQMEQDPPRNAERPVFRVVYSNPCWIYRKADLDRFNGVTLGMGSIPYIFRSGSRPMPAPISTMTTAKVAVHVDSCKGPVLTTVPLAPAWRKDGVVTLPPAAITGAAGVHDLCFAVENTEDPGTVWLLNYIQPTPR